MICNLCDFDTADVLYVPLFLVNERQSVCQVSILFPAIKGLGQKEQSFVLYKYIFLCLIDAEDVTVSSAVLFFYKMLSLKVFHRFTKKNQSSIFT